MATRVRDTSKLETIVTPVKSTNDLTQSMDVDGKIFMKIFAKDDNPLSLVTQDAFQKIRSSDPISAIFVVQRPSPVWNSILSKAESLENVDRKYLDASPILQLGDAQLQSLANDFKNNADLGATDIERCVRGAHGLFNSRYDSIRTFDSAAQVVRRKRGGPHEHAVLLAAILRTQGYPARVAGGVARNQVSKVMGYHVWTEVFAKLGGEQAAGGGDQWIALDCYPESCTADSSYLRLTESALASYNPLEFVLATVTAVQKIDVMFQELE